MNQIDFFGCSFTEAPMWEMLPKVGEFNLPLYSQHTQTTKPVSNFLEFDLAYNNITDYKVNNFGGGSFGNHFIKEVIKNRVNEIDKTKDNIAIVQLSALLRNPHSFETVFTSQYSPLTKIEKYNITCFNVKPENVRNDYFVEFDNMEDYYKSHIKNIQEMIEVLDENYKKYYIHFGWDVSTRDFEKLWEVSDLKSVVNSWKYEFPLVNLAYFENQEKYNRIDKKASGKFGGMLEYSANKLDESLRYVHIKDDHHPSYFSNKIFYIEVIREFLNPILNFNQDYFGREDLIKFEEFLKNLIPTKESTDGAIYAQFQSQIIRYIYNEILHK